MSTSDNVTNLKTSFTQGDRHYSFSLIAPESTDQICTSKFMYTTGRQTKHKIEIKLEGEMVVTRVKQDYDSTNIRLKKRLVKETYDMYLENIASVPLSNYKWIHNIIDGTSEQDRIIFQDDEYVLIPPFTSSIKKTSETTDDSNFHVLGITKNKELRSIRDLTAEHIPHLLHIYINGCEQIEKLYGHSIDRLKVYIHYPPSTWHLHIHFSTIDNTNVSSSVEYSHNLFDVIRNLELCNEYYKKYDIYTLQ